MTEDETIAESIYGIISDIARVPVGTLKPDKKIPNIENIIDEIIIAIDEEFDIDIDHNEYETATTPQQIIDLATQAIKDSAPQAQPNDLRNPEGFTRQTQDWQI
jgi:acyl carrier protein